MYMIILHKTLVVLLVSLFVSKDKDASGIFHGHFIGLHGESELSIKSFSSLSDDIISKAQSWITNIIPDAKKGPEREAGSRLG